MNTLRNVYRRLDRLQHTRSFRITAGVLALLLCGAVFGMLVVSSISLQGQRRALIVALTGQSLEAGDAYAVSLNERGTVILGGRTYGGPHLANKPGLIFQEGTGTIIDPVRLTDILLRDQMPRWPVGWLVDDPAPLPAWLVERPATTCMLAVIGTLWLLAIVWMALTIPFVLTLLGTAAAVLIAWASGSEAAVWALGGIGLLTFTFVLLTRLLLLALHRPHQLLAVAHTVLKEASRTKIPLVFIIAILVLLPLLPLGLDPDSPLRFRLQTFMSRSLGFTYYLAACMTLFLSCATVAFEIRDRQIWQLVTKPLHHANYLLGKWLGVVCVNLIIMVIAGVSIFTFIQYLREQPVAFGLKGQEDARQVQDAVLTARMGTRPTYETLTPEQLYERVDEAIRRDPELATLTEVPLLIRRQKAAEIVQAFAIAQRSVPTQGERRYVFEGLDAAKELKSTLTLRYRFHIYRDDEHERYDALFVFNDDPNLIVRRRYVPTVTHVMSIPSEFIDEDGTLVVSVINLFTPPPGSDAPGALNWEADDFELLYKVASFESNFFRAVLIIWIKLAFLAMLGITCATFLSFPVACLMSFTIFTAGTIGPFLAMSLQEYYPPMASAMDWGNVGQVIQWAFMSFIKFVAQIIVFLLEGFGGLKSTQPLVEGRLISWSVVGTGFFKIGVVWSGLSLLVGYIVIRRRQLAIYSGHG